MLEYISYTGINLPYCLFNTLITNFLFVSLLGQLTLIIIIVAVVVLTLSGAAIVSKYSVFCGDIM